MTGLEKILKAIEEEAQAGADAVNAQAKTEAEKILAAAKLEAKKQCDLIADKSETDVKAVLSRAESAAALQERKTILHAKQEIISNIITKARETLAELPDLEYTQIILELVKKHAHNKPGTILFSAADKKRLPEDFEDRLKNILLGKAGAQLSIADLTADIDGGFLLTYGDIEENCSFDALFSAEKDSLQDKVNSLLFE